MVAAVMGVVDSANLHTEPVAGDLIVQRYRELGRDVTWVLIRGAEPYSDTLVLSEATCAFLRRASCDRP